MNTGPTQAIIAVTYRCNARCGMCDIWRKEHAPEVEPSVYYHLPASLREINLSGGEPFLRDDLEKIVAVMTERLPGARILISSNGLLTERIARLTPVLHRLNPRLGLRVSIDGSAATHDRIRGIPGAHEHAWETLAAARRGGLRDLGIGFTMVAGNEEEMLPVYERAMALGYEFTGTVVHSSPIFFGEHDAQEPDREKAGAAYEELRRRQLRSWKPKNWFRAYFTGGLRDLVRGAARPIQCEAGTAFFYLDPYGTVFPCHLRDWPLGKIEEGYDRLRAQGAGQLERVTACRANCWMTCTVAPTMRRDLWWTAARVSVDRVKALVGWY